MDFKEVQKYMQIITDMAKNITNELPVVCMLYQNSNTYIECNQNDKHAEMIISEKYDCENGIIFVNLEPCPMCLFKLSLAKVKHIFFGSYNTQYGACGGCFHLKDQVKIPIVNADGGFLEKENTKIIQDFFKKKRIRKHGIEP